MLPSEATRLTIHCDKHDVAKCVCNLSQNPEFTRAAGKEHELHTLVRNSVVLWSCEHKRWMTGREMLLANSFPVNDAHLDLICGVGNRRAICSFNASRIAHGLSARDRVHMAHQSGNGSNIQSVGAVLQWLFMFMVTTPVLSANCIVSSPLGSHTLSAMSPLQQWKAACGDSSITPDPKRRRGLQGVLLEHENEGDISPLANTRRRI